MTPTRKDVEPTTSATDELRRLLDERGMEHYEHEAPATDCIAFFDGEGWHDCWESVDGEVNVTFSMTPEQAIAATLGSEETYTREDVEGAFVSGYSLGLDMFDSSKQEKGWNQNERNLDEEMEDLGWVRKDAATLDAGTCHEVEDEDTGFIFCSECGAIHDESYTGYYCWCCGCKVVDE